MPIPTRWLLAAAGTTASLAFAPSALAQEATQPTIKPNVCVERRDAGLRAHFWYERHGVDPKVLEIPGGTADNRLTPDGTVLVDDPFHPTIPERFEVEGRFAFAVDLGSEPVAWTLRDSESGEGGTAETTDDYAGRCIHAAFTAQPDADPAKPSGSTVRFAWTAEVSGVGDFRDPGAPEVPWSDWRSFHGNLDDPKCSLDGKAVDCEQSDVTLEDLAPGEHVFRVFAQPPLPEKIGMKAGTRLHDGLFALESRFTVAAPQPPVEEPKPPVQEPKPPVQEPKPPVQEPKPPVQEPKPPVEEPKPPVEPRPPVNPQPPVQPQPPIDPQPPVQPQPPACVKRSAKVTVPGVAGQRYRSVKVTVDGKRVSVRRVKGRLVATVAPSARNRTSSVRITIRFKSGKQRTFVRSVRTCF